ncbi:O-antigen ligase family protein [Glaciihabitans arcticus]|uniref:O-antigen ligase family protein n=1 Tax=Glaciihabitans arcticus TaxID=2668039 RepID=A0A4Q9GMS2_9MICO|nr:O-antigen ligase family protein [Glaciihabitans arcticus]TBN55971.1 O-antigen ligase family protein [Glaciihabitans arcticus]
MKFLDDRRFRMGFAVVALYTVLAGDSIRYSISWYGFGAVAVVLAVISVLLLVRDRHRWTVGGLPYPLIAFLALATLSITWSYYPGATAVGLLATWMTVALGLAIAICLDWADILRTLGWALRAVLGLSIVFELVVSLLIRRPVLPIFPSPGVDYDSLDKIPQLLYWSRNLLLEGDKIQGVVGNSSLLGFVALLGLIVFGIQLVARTVSRASGIAALLLAALTVYLTRSATIIVAIVVLAVVVGAVWLIRRATARGTRGLAYASLTLVAIAGSTLAIMFRSPLLGLLGKNDTLTHRTGIWEAVITLAQERPGFGWGWVSFWAPWVAPFNDLAFNSGVRQLHAHNAWLDLWLQVGVIGAVIFALLVLSSLVRSWLLATDRVITSPADTGHFTVQSLLPLLLLVALIVQSFAESRLLIEYGMVLLVIAAVKTKRDEPVA